MEEKISKLEEKDVIDDIGKLTGAWSERNKKFKIWYDILNLEDKLYKAKMESDVSNEPRTFYNMAQYLLTAGEIRHIIPAAGDSKAELDKQARVERACHYMWRLIDEQRQRGGAPPFDQELGFNLLVLGWYSLVMAFIEDKLVIELWPPADVYPKFTDRRLARCVHSYQLTIAEAAEKAERNKWNFKLEGGQAGTTMVSLHDYFRTDKNDLLWNMVLIDKKDVTGWVKRPDMKLLVAPVGGFPDQGSIDPSGRRPWQGLVGQSIFEADRTRYDTLNKWITFKSQILRDGAQPKYQEQSAGAPKVTTDKMRERGALIHFNVGEGISPIAVPPIPLEMTAMEQELRREIAKGSFTDAVYGMAEGGPGYAQALLVSASANQILHPYQTAKHFVVAECDKFWLSHLQSGSKVFEIKGRLLEELKPDDIPEEVEVTVDSDLATQKDWLEKATVANMLKEHLDDTTILDRILKMPDTQEIKRRQSLDRVLDHPMSQQIELISAYYVHADYLAARGDSRGASLFRNAAQAMEGQMSAPAPGQGQPQEMTRIQAQRTAGAPPERTRVRPEVMAPEERGIAPQELRNRIGRGTMAARR